MTLSFDSWAAWVTVRWGFWGFVVFLLAGLLVGFLVGIRYERGRRGRLMRRLGAVHERSGS